MTRTPQIEIKVFQGREIIPYLQEIAELRLAIFRDYPYLYEGTGACEARYLHMYALSEYALLVIVLDQNKIVGAVTGLPLSDSLKEIKELFERNQLAAANIFYLGEIVLLQKYRHQKIGHQMYQEFERAVDKHKYQSIAFCEVIQEKNSPSKPTNYKSLDHFWQGQGYVKYPHLVTHFSWQVIGAATETKHPMLFWIKERL